METYLAAILTYHLKPKNRLWMPGQSESTILITTPRKVEASRTRNITEEEASHRLSFLARLVDTEGQAIKSGSSSMRDEFYAEAYNTTDMFDQAGTPNLSHLIAQEQQAHHAEEVSQMRAAIQSYIYNYDQTGTSASQRLTGEYTLNPTPAPSPTIVQPTISPATQAQFNNLAHNPTYSIETIQQQADRIQSQSNPGISIPSR